MTKGVVVFSAGLDSTIALFWAIQNYDEVEAITFDYGQKARSELDAASRICQMANIKHVITWIPAFGGALIEPDGDTTNLKDSFVPGRGAIMLSIAASFAVSVDARFVVSGIFQGHDEDAQPTDEESFPDATNTFIVAMEDALDEALDGAVRLVTPLMWMRKPDVIKLAQRLPNCWDALSYSISCWNDAGGQHCGECMGCRIRSQGFHEAKVADPAPYVNGIRP